MLRPKGGCRRDARELLWATTGVPVSAVGPCEGVVLLGNRLDFSIFMTFAGFLYVSDIYLGVYTPKNQRLTCACYGPCSSRLNPELLVWQVPWALRSSVDKSQQLFSKFSVAHTWPTHSPPLMA